MVWVEFCRVQCIAKGEAYAVGWVVPEVHLERSAWRWGGLAVAESRALVDADVEAALAARGTRMVLHAAF